MSFQWPDPVSLVADIIAILGMPTLVRATWNLRSDIRKAREEAKKAREEAVLREAENRSREIVSVGCLEFLCGDTAVNLVPLERATAIPKVGDFVSLPGETRDGKNLGGGQYEVEKVYFNYLEAPEIDQPCPASPSKIIVHVRKRMPQ